MGYCLISTEAQQKKEDSSLNTSNESPISTNEDSEEIVAIVTQSTGDTDKRSQEVLDSNELSNKPQVETPKAATKEGFLNLIPLLKSKPKYSDLLNIKGARLKLLKETGKTYSYVGTKQKFKNFKLYLTYRWLDSNSMVKLSLFKKPESVFDIVLRYSKKPHTGSVTLKGLDLLSQKGDYLESDKNGSLNLELKENFENRLNEINRLVIIKNKNRARIILNKHDTGTIELPFEDESPIGFNFWNRVNIEIVKMELTELPSN